MREEVKEAWIAALESGEYRQGHSVLTEEDGKHCCLGVLCQLAVKAGVIDPPKVYSGFWEYGKEGADLVLPVEVAAWAGLPEDSAHDPDGDAKLNPRVPNPDFGKEDDEAALHPGLRQVSLAELNDADGSDVGEAFSHRYDFQAIANIIREHL